MQEFVQCVNSGIQIQEETERVRDAMNRITGFQVVDVPSDLKDVSWPHTPHHLAITIFSACSYHIVQWTPQTNDVLGVVPLSFTMGDVFVAK